VCVREREGVCVCVCVYMCVCCTASGVGELCVFEIQRVCVCVKESVCTDQNAYTPILTDGLMSLMPLSKPTASNEAD